MHETQQNQENNDVIELFNLVAPERESELNILIHKYDPLFFRASDQLRFILDENHLGFIRYSDRTLAEIWLLGWVVWKEMYCWSSFIEILNQHSMPFVLSEFDDLPDQSESYADADDLYSKAMAFIESDPIDWELWPSSIPKHKEIHIQNNDENNFINNIVLFSLAFIFLHEFRHFILHKESCTFKDPLDEEFECDRWATWYILADSETYSKTSNEDSMKVKTNRAMGIALGNAVIAHIQNLDLWEKGKSHPSIAERMKKFAENLDLSENNIHYDAFWNVSSCFLLASLRRQHALPARIEFSDLREFFMKLLKRFDL